VPVVAAVRQRTLRLPLGNAEQLTFSPGLLRHWARPAVGSNWARARFVGAVHGSVLSRNTAVHVLNTGHTISSHDLINFALSAIAFVAVDS
jgi:hypothetical protein